MLQWPVKQAGVCIALCQTSTPTPWYQQAYKQQHTRGDLCGVVLTHHIDKHVAHDWFICIRLPHLHTHTHLHSHILPTEELADWTPALKPWIYE